MRAEGHHQSRHPLRRPAADQRTSIPLRRRLDQRRMTRIKPTLRVSGESTIITSLNVWACHDTPLHTSVSGTPDGSHNLSLHVHSLDPDFDYDNVTLTARAFPFNQRPVFKVPHKGQ